MTECTTHHRHALPAKRAVPEKQTEEGKREKISIRKGEEGERVDDGVAIICLDCFRKGRSLYRYKYGVTKFFLHNSQGGTCTVDQSDPASTVVQRANYLFENGFGNYHLERNNCEDFALYCKTGILKIGDKGVGRSGQIINSLPLMRRIAIINGRDFIKVPVEDMDMDKFHCHQIAA